jgi:hypothetical protein
MYETKLDVTVVAALPPYFEQPFTTFVISQGLKCIPHFIVGLFAAFG